VAVPITMAGEDGSRSIDARLKDIPEVCNISKQLLFSLQNDLEVQYILPSEIATTYHGWPNKMIPAPQYG
jgi:hypothetical protein